MLTLELLEKVVVKSGPIYNGSQFSYERPS